MPAPPVGLDITPTALVAVALKRKGKGYAVVRHAVAPLEPGIVVDGEVASEERLAAAIADFWQQQGFRQKAVSLGLANQRCITRVVDLPRIKKKQQLNDAISFEVGDNLPIPIEDAVWAFHTVDTYRDEQSGVERQRHVVVMTYRESVERFRDAVQAAGLTVKRVDLSAFALMRAALPAVKQQLEATGADPEQHGVVALCDIGPTSTNVAISRDGVCEVNRLVAFGTQQFTQTLMEQFGWTREDSDRVRLEAGVLPLGGIESPGDPYTETRRVMQYVADQFAAELRTSFDYYTHSSEVGHRVERVVLSGEGALLRGIEERFATELGVPVSILDASPRLDAGSAERLGVNHAHFGAALGLAMEEAA